MRNTSQIDKILIDKLCAHRLVNLSGYRYENIKLIEKFYNIKIKIGYNEVNLLGSSIKNLHEAAQKFKQIYYLADRPISVIFMNTLLTREEMKIDMIPSTNLTRKNIQPRNNKQADYLKSIGQNDIVFAVGPAGTGKTYLAVSKAIECFEKGEVQRLVFVRPAVEAGEKLGFLPGDLVEKVLPYLRPIYDALYEMIGFKETQKLIQTDRIEILPLAFMRGRTLNEAFIILDEAQNTTISQMKMFLTRMGFGSKVVVTGDITQIDLPKGIESGLTHAIELFTNFKEISIHRFTSREVVRNPLISRIVDRYDEVKKD